MDASNTSNLTGRGHNDDELRPTYHNIIRSLTRRPTENHLFENGLSITEITGFEAHYTRIGWTM